MNKITFGEYSSIYRESLINFSTLFMSMISELKERISKYNFISLSLGRLTDSGFEIGNAINFFSVNLVGNSTIHAMYNDDHHRDDSGNYIPQKKVIRLDNPLAELPVLLNYKNNPKFFVIGEELSAYSQFIKTAREYLIKMVGQDITLYYKNDDLSVSIVSGRLKEVNKSNILMEDFHELLVRDDKTVSVTILPREKNHRFISQNGYLFQASPAIFEKENKYDDGQVFGNDMVWNFSLPQAISKTA